MSLTIQSGGSLTIQGGGGGGGGGGATVGTFANRPAAGNAGALYIATDSPIAQWVDDGSAWRPLIQGQALGTQVPAASAFTAFNGSTLTLADQSGAVSMQNSVATGGNGLRGGAISLSSPTAYVQGVIVNTSTADTASETGFGVFLRESSTGKAVGMVMRTQYKNGSIPATTYYAAENYSNNSMIWNQRQQAIDSNAPYFIRVYRSGLNTIVALSRDGINWKTVVTHVTSVNFTTAPDQVAFGMIDASVSSGSLLSFKYGSL